MQSSARPLDGFREADADRARRPEAGARAEGAVEGVKRAHATQRTRFMARTLTVTCLTVQTLKRAQAEACTRSKDRDGHPTLAWCVAHSATSAGGKGGADGLYTRTVGSPSSANDLIAAWRDARSEAPNTERANTLWKTRKGRFEDRMDQLGVSNHVKNGLIHGNSAVCQRGVMALSYKGLGEGQYPRTCCWRALCICIPELYNSSRKVEFRGAAVGFDGGVWAKYQSEDLEGKLSQCGSRKWQTVMRDCGRVMEDMEIATNMKEAAMRARRCLQGKGVADAKAQPCVWV
eukprot:6179579-Pleurochrysis_carterae.AAC.1